MTVRECLKPGDVLLYRPDSVWGWLIAVKTWHPISHCEAYVGHGMSVASRDGIGVGIYPTRFAQLTRILRPAPPINLEAAMTWFNAVSNQGYDWLGLFRFLTWRDHHPHDKQFCSAFLTRWLRHGGVVPFAPEEDADAIAPCSFLLSTAFIEYVVNNGLVTPARFIGGA